MKYILLFIAFSFVFAINRNRLAKKTVLQNAGFNLHVNPVIDSLPDCIAAMIRVDEKAVLSNLPEAVDEYLYKKQKVFLIKYACCDQLEKLYDDSCKYICSPFGGIAGNGDGKCLNFITEAKFIKHKWQKGVK